MKLGDKTNFKVKADDDVDLDTRLGKAASRVIKELDKEFKPEEVNNILAKALFLSTQE